MAPITSTEERVSTIYSEILELASISADDDIFSLGGDSLQAVRIALEIERAFDVSLPIEILEQSSRVSDVARWIDSQTAVNVPAANKP
ncbi:phosphopantetheine-binding protein [Mangrovicella endophytica]|uniref:phosphopantetheine-binding protein n=1 Tax=Mangrovicella endophytica TaxID=2066697 RepID=UPI0013000892|nr:phosphopantetheine-binding protein [Mangrovicella endophytica]